MSRAVTVSHIIYAFCIDFGAAPRTRRPHLTAVRARATPATATRSPRRAALLGAAYIRPVVLVLGCTTIYIGTVRS